MNSLHGAALAKNVLVVLLLASALAMIAFAVESNSSERLSHLPQLVHDKLKSFAGAI